MASIISAGTSAGTAIAISGDTTGNLAFQTQAGANTITVPNSTGTVLTTGSPQSGGVIQVVSANYATEVSTSSTAFVTTGLSATITPKFVTSKILIICHTPARSNSTSYSGNYTIYRGTVAGTNLAGSGNSMGAIYSSAGSIWSVVSLNYLDSPATTSAQTYTLGMQANNAANTAYAQLFNYQGTITLLEIAA